VDEFVKKERARLLRSIPHLDSIEIVDIGGTAL
jgi:hypothetical protein